MRNIHKQQLGSSMKINILLIIFLTIYISMVIEAQMDSTIFHEKGNIETSSMLEPLVSRFTISIPDPIQIPSYYIIDIYLIWYSIQYSKYRCISYIIHRFSTSMLRCGQYAPVPTDIENLGWYCWIHSLSRVHPVFMVKALLRYFMSISDQVTNIQIKTYLASPFFNVLRSCLAESFSGSKCIVLQHAAAFQTLHISLFLRTSWINGCGPVRGRKELLLFGQCFSG